MIAHYEDTKSNTFFSQLINLKQQGSMMEQIEDCWHYGTGLGLWLRYCPSWQPSLVTDLSSGTQKVEKDIYAGSSRRKHLYMRVILYKSTYMLVIILLVHGSQILELEPMFWTMASRQLCRSIVFGFMVLKCYGFGPWYWGRLRAIKEEGDLVTNHHLDYF